MPRNPTFVLLAALAALAAPRRAPGETAPDGVEREREAIARELVRIGSEIRREVLAGDVAALVARVPESGLRCGARIVPRSRVERDLRSASTWLHGAFFGGPGYAPLPGSPPSLAALLRVAPEVAVVVTFRPDERAGPAGRPCIDFREKGLVTPGAPLCFERRGGRFWFTESLYPCG